MSYLQPETEERINKISMLLAVVVIGIILLTRQPWDATKTETDGSQVEIDSTKINSL